MLEPKSLPMYDTLYDLCETQGLVVSIKVYKFAKKGSPAILGIVVYEDDGETIICEYKMGDYDNPPLNELAEYVLNDLQERGYFDATAHS